MIREIIDIVERKEIKVISFDIFDTLIFRHAKVPSDIFKKSFDKNPELFPEHIDAEDWRRLRIVTEKKARNEKYQTDESYEVTLDEIYSYLPKFFDNKKKIMEKEIEEEIDNCFKNPMIYDTILELSNRGHTIVLISDMYLSQSIISRIISSCDISTELFSGIFISNEYNKSKRTYGLYKEVLNKYCIRPEEMLHVGDNTISDIASAKQIHINTYFYNTISESRCRFPNFVIEGIAPFECDNENYSLRILSASDSNDFWYDIGATIFGPFYTYFAQWIIWEAKRRNINKIRPIMREGDFLSKIIRVAAEKNDAEVDVAPLFASRMAVFSAGFENITAKDIIYLLGTHNMRLVELFHILKMDDEIKEYHQYKDLTLNELKTIPFGEESVFDMIKEWLLNDEIIKLIREHNKYSSKTAIEYFKIMGLDNQALTIDLGWRGSIQNAIDRLFVQYGEMELPSHYLCLAKPDVANNLYPCSDIRGFLGNFGSDSELTRAPFARIIELSLMSTVGTTVGYTSTEKTEPIVMKVEYPEWQVKAIKRLQDGILHFQDNYYKYASDVMKDGSRIREKAPELYGIIDRMMRYPLVGEAKELKNLQYDQNMGGTGFTQILSDFEVEKIENMGIGNYYKEVYEYRVAWKSGMNSIVDPLIFIKSLNMSKASYKTVSRLLLIQDAIDQAETENMDIILVGAGRNLRSFIYYFIILDKISLVKSIWDNGEEKQGAIYNGISVTYPNKEEKGYFLCTVENVGIEKALCGQIANLFENDIIFRGLGYQYTAE